MTETAAGAPQPPVGETITVKFIPKAWADLRAACDQEHLSETDVVNRAVTLYEFITRQIAEGREVVIRDRDRAQQLVRLI